MNVLDNSKYITDKSNIFVHCISWKISIHNVKSWVFHFILFTSVTYQKVPKNPSQKFQWALYSEEYILLHPYMKRQSSVLNKQKKKYFV